jgi:HTH-type transcriptional regulator, sugar sensing transcriptional regulator
MYKYDEREPYYLELLANFGLKAKEAKVYLATLRLGQATVSKVAKESKVERSFVYNILDDLAKRGLVSLTEIKGKKHYQAISIESLKFLLEEKFERFKAFIPELKGLEKSKIGPNVRYFEGRDGLITIMQDTLNQPAGSENLNYLNMKGFWTDKEDAFSKWYVEERVRRKINLRMISPDNEESRWYAERDKLQKRQTRIVPTKDFPFESHIEIYGNKVAIISPIETELIGIIIESEAIAKTQRMIFELAWRGAKK